MKIKYLFIPFLLFAQVCGFCQTDENDCGNLKSGSINFKANVTKLNAAAIASMKKLAVDMRANPNCIVVIAGVGNSNKLDLQRSWNRVYATIEYLVEKAGIDRERFIFNYGKMGIANTVDYRGAKQGENGPNNVPPPFPNLRR